MDCHVSAEPGTSTARTPRRPSRRPTPPRTAPASSGLPDSSAAPSSNEDPTHKRQTPEHEAAENNGTASMVAATVAATTRTDPTRPASHPGARRPTTLGDRAQAPRRHRRHPLTDQRVSNLAWTHRPAAAALLWDGNRIGAIANPGKNLRIRRSILTASRGLGDTIPPTLYPRSTISPLN